MDKLLKCIYEDAEGKPITQFQAERDGWYMCASQIIKWLKEQTYKCDFGGHTSYKAIIPYKEWHGFLEKYGGK